MQVAVGGAIIGGFLQCQWYRASHTNPIIRAFVARKPSEAKRPQKLTSLNILMVKNQLKRLALSKFYMFP